MSKILVVVFVGCCYLWIIGYTVESYEFGYHPSSEEFDGVLREKTWTRDLLKQERNTKKFTPKFNLSRPKENSFGSNLINTPFSDAGAGAGAALDGGSVDKYDHDPLEFTHQGDQFEISSESVTEVNRNENTTLPIFFTNPVTGIVYAITEVGVNTNRTELSNSGGIPIFVSKEQYERDLYLLKRSYESKCSSLASSTSPSSSASPPGKKRPPHIIHIDNVNTVRKPTSTLVKTRFGVRNNTIRIPKQKKRKPHRKSKKAKEFKKLENPLEKLTYLLDTQLEKPSRLNLPSVFSGAGGGAKVEYNAKKPKLGSIFSRSLNETFFSAESQEEEHKILRRSVVNASENRPFFRDNILPRSINSSDSTEKSKKILSTQIQVTSEYLEPPLKIRTPKNSIEETSHTEKTHTTSPHPPNSQKPQPCKESKSKPKAKKKPPSYNEYDENDDLSFGGTSYNDYNSGSDESDDDSQEDQDDDESSLENNVPDYDSLEGTSMPTTTSDNYRNRKTTRKRIKRRRPYGSDEYDDDYDDNDDDYDNESDDGVLGIFRGVLTPVQWVMDTLFDRAGQMFNKRPPPPPLPETNDNRKPKFPQYTVYNSGSNDVATGNEETANGDQGNSLGSWFGSWFGFSRRRGSSTTPAPAAVAAEEEPGWFESWFGFDTQTPTQSEEESEPWFFGWFNAKPRPKRTTTTTTTTTTSVPILTISEPLKNPHKWIGILAQHIINSTSTNSPPIEATTENPDIPKKISYNKYQIWRIKPKTDSQVKILEEIKRGEEGTRLQWLKGPTLRGLTDVVIPPKMLTDFEGTLESENIDHEILIFDVGKVISYEQAKQDDIVSKKPNAGKAIMSWNRYYDYDSIIKYLELIQVRNTQYVELIHIGRSYEGRPLVIAKVESRKSNEKLKNKKKLKLNKYPVQADSVFIEAGVHGREWIAPASATWMINELLKIMKNNKTNLGSQYVKNTTWYIMPVANPDGYEYSHQYDRLWKKSRSRHISKPNGIIDSAMTWLQKKKSEKVCFGVDLDHNWHFNWGRKGSSKTPCNEFFAGPASFSEPETRAISKFLMDNRKHIKLFASLQAYGQIISYPNKMNSSFQADKLDDLLDVAMVATDSLRKRGSNSRYKVDATNDLIENKAGSSDYFASFEVGIPFSYTIHLADNGVHGFLLPSTLIEPTARDAFDMITAMIDYI